MVMFTLKLIIFSLANYIENKSEGLTPKLGSKR
jgi:hypothetical protein